MVLCSYFCSYFFFDFLKYLLDLLERWITRDVIDIFAPNIVLEQGLLHFLASFMHALEVTVHWNQPTF